MKKRISRQAAAELATTKIIEQLEKGTVPWQTPWTPFGGPTSLATGKPYKGINHVMLSFVGMTYEYPLWGTYKWAFANGGHVRKGERNTPVIFMEWVTKEDEKTQEIKQFPLYYIHQVFNIGQMEGVEVPAQYLTKREPVPVLDGVHEALNYPGGPTVVHDRQDMAFYRPSTDVITLPMLDQFKSAEKYAGTALHEAVHSTGHKSRLGRLEENATFGCQSYAKEELVAEMGAALLGTMLNIQVEWEQSGAYIASWLRVLKNDRDLLLTAATQAQKAAELICPAEELAVAA